MREAENNDTDARRKKISSSSQKRKKKGREKVKQTKMKGNTKSGDERRESENSDQG